MGRIRDNRNYLELSIDQLEQIKLLRKLANVSLSEIARLMSCSTCKIARLESGKGKVDTDFYHKIIKKYESFIRYKDK